MAKTRHINFKVSEDDFKKLTALMHGKTIGQLMRELITEAVKKERQDVNSFLELIRKLDNSDLSKISEKLNEISAVLNRSDEQKYLKRILGEAIRGNIAIEELAKRRLGRTDFYQQFLDEIEKRLEAKRQKGGQ